MDLVSSEAVGLIAQLLVQIRLLCEKRTRPYAELADAFDRDLARAHEIRMRVRDLALMIAVDMGQKCDMASGVSHKIWTAYQANLPGQNARLSRLNAECIKANEDADGPTGCAGSCDAPETAFCNGGAGCA